jgi:hypothetical protein
MPLSCEIPRVVVVFVLLLLYEVAAVEFVEVEVKDESVSKKLDFVVRGLQLLPKNSKKNLTLL